MFSVEDSYRLHICFFQAADRRLSLGPVKVPDPHERLLNEIRGEPKLKPTPGQMGKLYGVR